MVIYTYNVTAFPPQFSLYNNSIAADNIWGYFHLFVVQERRISDQTD
jgi:hypothetical protein